MSTLIRNQPEEPAMDSRLSDLRRGREQAPAGGNARVVAQAAQTQVATTHGLLPG